MGNLILDPEMQKNKYFRLLVNKYNELPIIFINVIKNKQIRIYDGGNYGTFGNGE